MGTCWVSQQLAHMLRAGREEQEGAGRDSPALLLLADRHRAEQERAGQDSPALLLADRHQELNRHLFIGDRYSHFCVYFLSSANFRTLTLYMNYFSNSRRFATFSRLCHRLIGMPMLPVRCIKRKTSRKMLIAVYRIG